MKTIDQKYAELGGAGSFRGVPVHEERSTPNGKGRYRTYQNGSIHWHPETGAFETHGAIREMWKAHGWENGFLGFPTSDESDFSTIDYTIMALGDPSDAEPTPFKVIGRCSHFQGGCIVWWSSTNSPLDGSATVFVPPSGWYSVWTPLPPPPGIVDKAFEVLAMPMRLLDRIFG